MIRNGTNPTNDDCHITHVIGYTRIGGCLDWALQIFNKTMFIYTYRKAFPFFFGLAKSS